MKTTVVFVGLRGLDNRVPRISCKLDYVPRVGDYINVEATTTSPAIIGDVRHVSWIVEDGKLVEAHVSL